MQVMLRWMLCEHYCGELLESPNRCYSFILFTGLCTCEQQMKHRNRTEGLEEACHRFGEGVRLGGVGQA